MPGENREGKKQTCLPAVKRGREGRFLYLIGDRIVDRRARIRAFIVIRLPPRLHSMKIVGRQVPKNFGVGHEGDGLAVHADLFRFVRPVEQDHQESAFGSAIST